MRHAAILVAVLGLLGVATAALASDTPRRLLAIEPRSPWTLRELEQLGATLVSYDPDTGMAYVTADPREERLLFERGFAVSTLELDVNAGFDRLQQDPGLGLYTTWDELLVELANLHRMFPDLTAIETLGTSLEGRSIPALKISDEASMDDPNEPDVLIVGNHHARELMSVEVPLHLARTLLSGYAQDPRIRRLVDEREVWIVPMLNPDGHVYQEETQQRPGWRKNRRVLDDGVFGVDLNRNYPFRWGLDDEGSSGEPFSETYRGATPLSEPESQALVALVERQDFTIALSYHSFGELLLYPWGHSRTQSTPDHDVYVALAAEMVRDNGYRPGNAANGAIYITNGGWGDYMYGETNATKDTQTFAFTVELNSIAQGGFWPAESLIQPTCERLLSLNLYTLEVAADVRAAAPPAAPVLSGTQDDVDPWIVHLTWEQPGDAQQVSHYEVFEIDPLGTAAAWTQAQPVTFSADGRAVLAEALRLAPSGRLALRLEAAMEPLWDYAYVEVRSRDSNTWSVLSGDVTRHTNPTLRNNGQGITGSLERASYVFDAREFVGRELDVAVRLDAHGDTPHAPYLDAALDVPATLTEERRVIAPEVYETHYDVHAERAGIFAYGVTAVDTDGQRTDSELRWFSIPEVTAVEIEATHFAHSGGRGALSWQTRSRSEARYEVWTRALRADEEPGLASDEWRRGDFERVAHITRAEPGPVRLEWQLQPGRRAVLLVAVDDDGARVWGPWVAAPAPASATQLEPASPNPFNPVTRLRYEVASGSRVTLDIVDVTGRRVRRLVHGVLPAGSHAATWDGRDDDGRELASGVYVARLQAAGVTRTRRLVLLR